MMPAVREIICERILTKSQIPLGDYVVNPYRGCVWGCRYCYVRKNKHVQKRAEAWGSFVDVKINAVEKLKEQLCRCTLRRVLLGSTTEVYQPCEKKYGLTREIIKTLNQNQIPVTIMTRSPDILRDLQILLDNPDPVIYFTVTPLPPKVRVLLEGSAPPNHERIRAIKELVKNNICVHVYLNPVIPYISNVEEMLGSMAGGVQYLDIESINPTMTMCSEILNHLYQDDSVPIGKVKEVFADSKKMGPILGRVS